MPKKTNFEQVPLEVVKKVLKNKPVGKKRPNQVKEPRRKSWNNSFGDRQDQWERQKNMTHRLDIFRVETSGVLWVDSAVTLEDAKARVQELAVLLPADYLLLDQKTGAKLVIKPNGAQGTGR